MVYNKQNVVFKNCPQFGKDIIKLQGVVFIEEDVFLVPFANNNYCNLSQKYSLVSRVSNKFAKMLGW